MGEQLSNDRMNLNILNNTLSEVPIIIIDAVDDKEVLY